MPPLVAASVPAVGSASFCIPALVNQTAGRSAAPSLLSLSLPLPNKYVPTFHAEICELGLYGYKTCGRYLFVILSQPDADIIKLRNGIRRFEIFYIWAAVFLPYRHLCLQTTTPHLLPSSGRSGVLKQLYRGLQQDVAKHWGAVLRQEFFSAVFFIIIPRVFYCQKVMTRKM